MAEAGDFHKIGNLRGKDGLGVPIGGTQGEVLQKTGGSDFATAWGRITYADIEGKVPAEDLPQISTEPYVVASESAMLNLPAAPGRMAIRTDVGKTFVLAELPASTLANWVELKTTSDVQSVNDKTGNVVLTKADVGLGNVNNTADADKPVATASVNGLMPKADKEALTNATSGAVNNTLAKRDAAGRISFRQVTISDAPTSSGHTATKGYTDDLFGTLAGGSVLSDTDWDAMRSTASTGVIEGWPKGCPIGGAIDATYNFSAGFVRDPVWKLEVRAEGLGYVTQRATLLNCVPKYMVGFVWERLYNPATAKWSAWSCVAGDSGEVKSVDMAIADTGPERPFIHRNSASLAELWKNGDPITVRRIGPEVRLYGVMRGFGENLKTTNPGRPLGWFSTIGDALGAGDPGADYTMCFPIASGIDLGLTVMSVQHGSNDSKWLLGTNGNNIICSRYDGPVPSYGAWLPFNVTYPAPSVNTNKTAA